MAKHFIWGFLYWARTGKRSHGYVLNRRDYHHALDRYRERQRLKCERNELRDDVERDIR